MKKGEEGTKKSLEKVSRKGSRFLTGRGSAQDGSPDTVKEVKKSVKLSKNRSKTTKQVSAKNGSPDTSANHPSSNTDTTKLDPEFFDGMSFFSAPEMTALSPKAPKYLAGTNSFCDNSSPYALEIGEDGSILPPPTKNFTSPFALEVTDTGDISTGAPLSQTSLNTISHFAQEVSDTGEVLNRPYSNTLFQSITRFAQEVSDTGEVLTCPAKPRTQTNQQNPTPSPKKGEEKTEERIISNCVHDLSDSGLGKSSSFVIPRQSDPAEVLGRTWSESGFEVDPSTLSPDPNKDHAKGERTSVVISRFAQEVSDTGLVLPNSASPQAANPSDSGDPSRPTVVRINDAEHRNYVSPYYSSPTSTTVSSPGQTAYESPFSNLPSYESFERKQKSKKRKVKRVMPVHSLRMTKGRSQRSYSQVIFLSFLNILLLLLYSSSLRSSSHLSIHLNPPNAFLILQF